MVILRRLFVLFALPPVLIATQPLNAGIVPIGPFTGTNSENFDHLGVDGATQTLSVLGGIATIQNLTSGGALKVEMSSSLDGDLVVPRSPPWMVGQLGIARWTFSSPVSEFGGYFQNNSRFDDAVVDFYDGSGSLLGELDATIPKATSNWTWNGWHSDIPISTIVITGNDVGFLNGFIWYDDFQANVALSSVPEPASWALLTVPCLVAATRACRRAVRSRRLAARHDASVRLPSEMTDRSSTSAKPVVS
jgi:hypothetical protein